MAPVATLSTIWLASLAAVLLGTGASAQGDTLITAPAPTSTSACTMTATEHPSFYFCTSTLYAATTTDYVDCSDCALESILVEPGRPPVTLQRRAGGFVCRTVATVTSPVTSTTVCAPTETSYGYDDSK